MKLHTFKIGGVHPEENKITAEIPTKVAELPKQAIFMLSQHIGAPAKAVVQRGDKVKVGTLLAEAGGFVSAPVYSSVSGTVAKIDNVYDATGYRKPAIIINVDEEDEWEESIDRSDTLETLAAHPELTSEEIVNRVKVAGVTGMGGAGFPTFIKLCPPPTAKAEFVIINAVECEPYITSDYRLMMEHADEILVGVELLMKAAKVDKGFIGIEENKPEAIRLLTELCKEHAGIEVVPLKTKYPQGGEKQLVDAVVGRQVPAPPAIPVNVGAIVQNVGTAYAVYQAVMKNKPLFERYTTVTGKHIKNPSNFLVRMGTPMSQLIEACGGLPDDDNKVLASFFNLDDISCFNQVGRNCHFLAVNQNMTMVDQLSCLLSCGGKSHSEYHVVKAALKKGDKVLTCLTFHSVCFFKGKLELLLQKSIDKAHFLLFSKLEAIS